MALRTAQRHDLALHVDRRPVGQHRQRARGDPAAVGVVAGGAKSRQQVSQQQIDTFYKAFGACMQGRGYTVK